MDNRRTFLKLAPLAAIPAATALASNDDLWSGPERGREIVGAWNLITTLAFPPGFFREFVTFTDGGALQETNSFLHTASNLDFSMFGLPSVVNASDGFGAWEHTSNGAFQAVFRKLLFDASRQNFGDLYVTGALRIEHGKFSGSWHVEAVDPSGALIADLGPVTSEGIRLR